MEITTKNSIPLDENVSPVGQTIYSGKIENSLLDMSSFESHYDISFSPRNAEHMNLKFTYRVVSIQDGTDMNSRQVYTHYVFAQVSMGEGADFADGDIVIDLEITLPSHNENGPITTESITREATINIRDVNEKPTDIILSANQDTAGKYIAYDDTRIIGRLTVEDPDEADGANIGFYTHSLEIVGDAARYFMITENNELAFNSSLESNFRFDNNSTEISVTIIATDNPRDTSNQELEAKTFTITIEDVNEAPTDIILDTDFSIDSEGTIKYITGDDSVIGTLTASDPDANDGGAPPSNGFAVHRFTLDVNSQKYLMIERGTDGVSKLKFKVGADKDFRYKNDGNDLVVTITATDNPNSQSGGRNSFSKTFTINVEEGLVLHAPPPLPTQEGMPPAVINVNEDGYFTFMQKGTISARGEYMGDNDDLYLTGEPTKYVTAVFTVTKGTLSTGQELDDYNTDDPDDHFMVDSVANTDGEHTLTFKNIQVQDLAALIEGLIYYAPDVREATEAQLEIVIRENDKTSIENGESVTTLGNNIIEPAKIGINIIAIDDDPSIVGLDNYLIHQNLIDTISLNKKADTEENSKDLADYTVASLTAARAVRLDHNNDGIGRISDNDDYIVAGGSLRVRVKFDDDISLKRTDAIHITLNDGFSDRKAVFENTPTATRSDVSYLDFSSGTYTPVTVAVKEKIKLSWRDKSDYEYKYTFATRPEDSAISVEDWNEMQKEVLDAILHNMEYTSGGFNVGANMKIGDIPVLDESLITIQFTEGGDAAKTTDAIAIRVADDRGADIANGGHDIVIGNNGRAARENAFADGSIIPTDISHLDAKARVKEIAKSFLIKKDGIHEAGNEYVKITREQTSSIEDDVAEDGSVSGPTIIRYYMPTETADIDAWHKTINGANHIDSPSAISNNNLRIGSFLSRFEPIANIKFEAVTDINTQRPDIVFMKGGNIKTDGIINDDLKAKTVIQEVTGIPGHSGTHKLSTIFFKDFSISSHEWLREIGYALGLRNPIPQLGDEGLSYLPYAEVNFLNTIYGLENIKSGKRLDPQGYDIAALQALYDPRDAEDISHYSRYNDYDQYKIIYTKDNAIGLPQSVIERSNDRTIDLADGGYSGLHTVKYASFGIDDVIQGLTGSYFNGVNNLLGNAYNNFIGGNARHDTIDGRAGSDEVFYRTSGVTVDLRKQIQGSQDGRTTVITGDVLINIENLRGYLIDDILIGNNDHNRLNGWYHSDTLTGNGGRDTFVADLGSFLGGHDTITDFERGIDKLEIEYYIGTRDLAAFRAAIDDGDITLAYQTAPTLGGHAIKISHSNGRHSITINFLDSIADVIGTNPKNKILDYDQLTQALGSVDDPVAPIVVDVF